MKITAMLRRGLPVALPVLLFTTFPILLFGQASGSQLNSHDLVPQIKLFYDYAGDFGAVVGAGAVGCPEAVTAGSLAAAALNAEDYFTAANVMLQMYDSVSSEPDKLRVGLILKGVLAFYSSQMNREADSITGTLTVTKLPVVVQTALRMKDDIRAGKAKLDAIASSLDQ